MRCPVGYVSSIDPSLHLLLLRVQQGCLSGDQSSHRSTFTKRRPCSTCSVRTFCVELQALHAIIRAVGACQPVTEPLCIDGITLLHCTMCR